MIEIRIHGRGGQGNVVAAYLLAAAAIEHGRHAQAFPSFGAERRGAPVVAFVRIADRPVRQHAEVRTPDYLIIQDRGLLHIAGVLDGLKPGGGILLNTRRAPTELDVGGRELITVPAGNLAQQILGRPVPNTALLAAFLALTGLLPVEALIKALQARFKGDVLARNIELVQRAAALVPAGRWQQGPAYATGT